MNVFNSLGSNYTFPFALKTLFAGGDKSRELKEYLEKRYGGKVVLLYKGREAIELALTLIGFPKGIKVAVNGFTCFAVYRAIEESGYTSIYIDIEKDSLNFTSETLLKELKKDPNIKVVIIQNTLGYPAEGEKIARICKERKVILIEDLAHSVGAKYESGTEAGTLGDFTVLSFSQDKMIDAVSGGALIIRNKKYQDKITKLKKLPLKQQIIDRMYPELTWKIRTYYPFFIGKLTHAFLKSMKLLSAPMAGSGEPTALPGWYTVLAKLGFENLEENLNHRKEIAKMYSQTLKQEVLLNPHINQIEKSTNLRFPILVKNRISLISYLKKRGVYISDIWYDAPIAPKKYMEISDYSLGSCPNSEKISEMILNLPTHRNVSLEDSVKIAQGVNKWLSK